MFEELEYWKKELGVYLLGFWLMNYVRRLILDI